MFRHPPSALGLLGVSIDRPLREPLAGSVGHHVVPATIVVPNEGNVEQTRHPSAAGRVWRKSGLDSSRRPPQEARNSLPSGE